MWNATKRSQKRWQAHVVFFACGACAAIAVIKRTTCVQRGAAKDTGKFMRNCRGYVQCFPA